MVFQNKGGIKAKQQTPAKQKGKGSTASDFFEMDSDDSVDNSVMKKTPQGRQSQVDRRVSFQMPGKITPSGKAKNGNSFGKKQLTPGRPTALKEFKGILTQNSAKNKSQKEQDSDDDEEEEDDDEDADLNILLGGYDDDDDEEGEDDDEEENDNDEEENDNDEEENDNDEEENDNDEEENDEEEEKQSALKKKQNSSDGVQKKGNSFIDKTPQKSYEKTPIKKFDKNQKNRKKIVTGEEDDDEENQQNFQPKKKQSVQQNQANALKKGASFAESKTPLKIPKKEKQTHEKREFQIGRQKALELTEDQKRARKAKTLFIGGLPKDVTETELQALSADIILVDIPYASTTSKRKFSFAFLEFSDESKAEENYKLLKNKKLRDQKFKLDFAGFKSQNQNKDQNQNVRQEVDMRQLFVSNLSPDVTMDKIAKFFPKAFKISLSPYQLVRTATIQFVTDKDAAEAVEATSSAEIDGRPITVVYSSQGQKSKKRKRSGKDGENKRMKLNNKLEVADDDENDEEE